MNEPNNNNEHTLELIHAGVDGELSRAQQRELDQLLATSAEARALQQEWQAFGELLDELPDRDPPGYLQSAITSQVRLPIPGENEAGNKRFLSAWAPAHWQRTGLAMAAATVFAIGIVGVYKTGPGPFNPADTSRMAGTVAPNTVTGQGALLDHADIDTGRLQGKVELLEKGDVLVLNAWLNSDDQVVFSLDIGERGLAYEGASPGQGSHSAIAVSDGAITVTGYGAQQFALTFRRVQDKEGRHDMPLQLGLFAGDKLIHEAQLSVSREDSTPD